MKLFAIGVIFMIVRDNKDTYIFIEQNHHASISGEFAFRWKNALFLGKDFRPSVEYAVCHHDLGWKYVDKHPFWNDILKEPYDFHHFPVAAKTAIYRQGIDEVEEKDRYAALLCSMHYSRFLRKSNDEFAQQFVKQEQRRQSRIIKYLGYLNERLLNFHFELLLFADQLSLYVCLHEPGVSEQQVHPFFRQGIRLPSNTGGDKLQIKWQEKNTIQLHPFPFEEEFSITVLQKRVKKNKIAASGIAPSYANSSYEEILYRFLPM